MEYADFILGLLSGIVLTIIGQFIGYYFTKRSLKAQQEHSERIAKIQLYHEDKKKALIELDELVKKKYKTFPKFRETIESFLNGSSGLFLPDKLRRGLIEQIRGIDALIYGRTVEIYGPEPEYPDYEDWVQAYSPEQVLEMEVQSRLKGLKGSMRDKIRKYTSGE